MKKILVSFAIIMMAVAAWAIPAKPGVKKLQTKDGGTHSGSWTNYNCTSGGTVNIQYGWRKISKDNIKLKYTRATVYLPGHCETKNTSTAIAFGELNLNDNTTTTKTIQLTNYIKSYYAQNGAITVSISGTNSRYFSVNNSTIANQGTVYADASCFSGGTSGDFTSPSSVTITYAPQSLGSHEAYLEIWYNGNKEGQIKLTANAKIKPNITPVGTSSPELFSTHTLTGTSTGTANINGGTISLASSGTYSFEVLSTYNNGVKTASIKNATSNSCDVTVNSRGNSNPESEVPTIVKVSISENGNYYANETTYTITVTSAIHNITIGTIFFSCL